MAIYLPFYDYTDPDLVILLIFFFVLQDNRRSSGDLSLRGRTASSEQLAKRPY